MFGLQKKDWIILALAVLNVALLVVIFSAPKPVHGPPEEHNVRERLERELELDNTQKADFKRLQEDYFRESRVLHRHLRKNKHAMLQTLQDTPDDSTRLAELTGENAALQQQLDELLIRHFRELKEVCTPEQLEQLHGMFMRSLRPHGAKRKRMKK